MLYVLIAEAVYDHGVLGLFTTKEQAEEYARELWDKTDGHHHFRVEPMKVDQRYAPTFDLRWFDLEVERPFSGIKTTKREEA